MTQASPKAQSRQTAELGERLVAMREATVRFPGSMRVADALAATFERWRDRGFLPRRNAVAKIAAAFRWSGALLEESLDAILAPFSRAALEHFAASTTPRARVGGFVMPANVPGAGMHELVLALISGAGAMVKTSNREPVFFHEFARTLSDLDRNVGSRVEVITFTREREDLTDLMKRHCDFIVALGDDETIQGFANHPRLFGFGNRASGALISLAAPANLAALAAAVACDITLFEQQGCLSPHHIFVEDPEGVHAHDFAGLLASAMDSLAGALPPAKLSFHTAASIRRIRENARWRGIGAHQAELYEGGEMAWTVVFDPAARFIVSPGYRTVTVTQVRHCADLESRLAPVAGRLEAFALAAPHHARARFLDLLAGAGVTYVCDPGMMQSPPISWPHGSGAFLDFISARNE